MNITQTIVFETLKKHLQKNNNRKTNKNCDKNFGPKKEVTLTRDASEHPVTAIIWQESDLAIFLWSKLTSVATNYSNAENEALTKVWSIRTDIFIKFGLQTIRIDI